MNTVAIKYSCSRAIIIYVNVSYNTGGVSLTPRLALIVQRASLNWLMLRAPSTNNHFCNIDIFFWHIYEYRYLLLGFHTVYTRQFSPLVFMCCITVPTDGKYCLGDEFINSLRVPSFFLSFPVEMFLYRCQVMTDWERETSLMECTLSNPFS